MLSVVIVRLSDRRQASEIQYVDGRGCLGYQKSERGL